MLRLSSLVLPESREFCNDTVRSCLYSLLTVANSNLQLRTSTALDRKRKAGKRGLGHHCALVDTTIRYLDTVDECCRPNPLSAQDGPLRLVVFHQNDANLSNGQPGRFRAHLQTHRGEIL